MMTKKIGAALIDGGPMTENQYDALLYELYKLIKSAPTKEAALAELYSLLDDDTREREVTSCAASCARGERDDR